LDGGDNGAGDEVPLVVQCEQDHGLHVEFVLEAPGDAWRAMVMKGG
jgi:hypothetical protein